MKIIFMGTPEFAAASLEGLLRAGHDVICVFTQPDKPQNRGMALAQSAVKQVALRYNIRVEQPESLKTKSVMNLLRELAPDLIIVVAYGKILPKSVLELPKLGCVNIHASLLPKYRGSSPIQSAILAVDTVTGVTAMYMDEGVDTGDMILKMELPIEEIDTADSLHDKLAVLGKACLLKTLELFASGIKPIGEKQDENQATHTVKLEKGMGLLDFAQPMEKLVSTVRGLYSWPCAYCYLDGKMLKVMEAKACPDRYGPIGQILPDKRFIVACGDGAIELVTVQPEGKRRMSGSEYLRGKRIESGLYIDGYPR